MCIIFRKKINDGSKEEIKNHSFKKKKIGGEQIFQDFEKNVVYLQNKNTIVF